MEYFPISCFLPYIFISTILYTIPSNLLSSDEIRLKDISLLDSLDPTTKFPLKAGHWIILHLIAPLLQESKNVRFRAGKLLLPRCKQKLQAEWDSCCVQCPGKFQNRERWIEFCRSRKIISVGCLLIETGSWLGLKCKTCGRSARPPSLSQPQRSAQKVS